MMRNVEAAAGEALRQLTPELDYSALERAAASYFPDGVALSPATCAERAERFYATLDLAARGGRWSDVDESFLRMVFPFVSRLAGRGESPGRRLLIIGCGTGRLAETYLELAAAYGFQHVDFNDLFERHIEATKVKVNNLRAGVAEALSISYHVGDFANLDIPTADVAIAMFFVSSEVCSIQSPAALAEARQRFYSAVHRTLKPNGIFIEDIPERDLTGFYSTLGNMTGMILRNLSAMHGREEDLSISHLPKPDGSETSHIRCIPRGDQRLAELRKAGLQHWYGWCEQARQMPGEPEPPLLARRIKRIDLVRQHPESKSSP